MKTLLFAFSLFIIFNSNFVQAQEQVDSSGIKLFLGCHGPLRDSNSFPTSHFHFSIHNSLFNIHHSSYGAFTFCSTHFKTKVPDMEVTHRGNI